MRAAAHEAVGVPGRGAAERPGRDEGDEDSAKSDVPQANAAKADEELRPDHAVCRRPSARARQRDAQRDRRGAVGRRARDDQAGPRDGAQAGDAHGVRRVECLSGLLPVVPLPGRAA